MLSERVSEVLRSTVRFFKMSKIGDILPRPPGITMKSKWIILGIIAVCALTVRLTFIHEPLERDEGFYATIGNEILHGGIPYRDAIDLKPPGVFYLYALAISLFGPTVESIRLFTALYSLGTLAAIYALTSRFAGVRAGLFAAALFALFSGAPLVQGSSSNCEVFMLLPLTLSAYCFVVWLDTQRRGYLAASGFFAGAALLIKTVALPFVALLFLFSLLKKYSGNQLKERGLNALSFTMPLVLLASAIIAAFSLKGALHDFLEWNIMIPLFYAKGNTMSGNSVSSMLGYLAPELLILTLAAVPTAVWLVIRRRNIKDIFISMLLPACVLGVAMPGLYFPHYFIQLFPVLSVLGGVGLAEVIQRKGPTPYVAGIVFAVLFSYYVIKEYAFFFVYSPEQVSIEKYGPTFVESAGIANYLKANTSPEDSIFQWGFEPELYFLSGRRPPVPYISSTVFGGLAEPQPVVQTMIQTLQNKKPKFIIYQIKWAQYPGEQEITEFIRTQYTPVGRSGYFLIYKRAS